MTVINTNSAAIIAQQNLARASNAQETAMAQLSSGKRINAAADDAAGISQVTRMEAQIVGLNQAVRNANEGMTLVDTAEGAMDEMRNMLLRMRELAVQSATATYSDTDRANLNIEVEQLKEEMDRVVGTTRFNGQLLLDGTFAGNLQIGANAGETIGVQINNLATNSLGSVSGAVSVGAVTEASAEGVAATPTRTQLSFNSNDTYTFELEIETAEGTGTYTIEADVMNNSAAGVAEAINRAIRDSGGANYMSDTSAMVNVSYSGNVLVVENTYGGAISINASGTNPFSTSGATIGVSSLSGGSGSDNLMLGSRNALAATSFENANSYIAAVPASVTLSEDGTLATGDVFEIVLDDGQGNTLTVTPDALTSAGDGDGLTSVLTAFNRISDKQGYTMELDGNGGLTISRADGQNFTVGYGDSMASGGANLQHNISTGGDLSATPVSTTNGTVAVGDAESNMYLEFTAPDTYTFNFSDGDGSNTQSTGSFDVVYDGTEASLSAIATQIGTRLNALGSDTNDFSVTAENGRITITDRNGQNFSLSSFASAGSGKVMASVDRGQGTPGNDGVWLDDTVYATSATTTAAGIAEETEMTLSFSADDRYSFNITDGTSTAVISNFGIDVDSEPSTNYVVSEINAALERAGLDNVMTASAVEGSPGQIVLTHSNGSEISIKNFKSDSTGVVRAEATGENNTGFTRFLDDGDGAVGETVSGISMLTADGASNSIEVIDRALEDITSERSTLGAVSNRLEHTVNNLGNIVVNTETAQSRLEDADFAAASTELAKSQILNQAATAMLAQANSSKQGVLSLLRG